MRSAALFSSMPRAGNFGEIWGIVGTYRAVGFLGPLASDGSRESDRSGLGKDVRGRRDDHFGEFLPIESDPAPVGRGRRVTGRLGARRRGTDGGSCPAFPARRHLKRRLLGPQTAATSLPSGEDCPPTDSAESPPLFLALVEGKFR